MLSTPSIRSSASPRPLRIGFIPLSDAAPIIVAQEHGFFRRHGLRVELSREVGWATIRDKLIYGELDATHALGAMVISTTLGLNCQQCECLTAFVLNTNGNCLTLSEDLWQRGVRDAATMRDEINRSRRERVYVFGVVFAYSSHRILVCDWLRSAGLDPDRDVRIVVVPPPQLFRNLLAGTLDGYCVGDPWNSLAVRENAGLIDLSFRAQVRMTGEDRVSFLQGMISNDVKALRPGDGCRPDCLAAWRPRRAPGRPAGR